MTKQRFNHFDEHGNARMVDIGDKTTTARRAIATGRITMQSRTLELIRNRGHVKGDVLAVARIAGIMAAKKTADLIPLCHPISLTSVDVGFQYKDSKNCVECEAIVETRERTGVEMESLTAVQVALLTIYDMCKKVDRDMVLGPITLIEKSGGASGHWRRADVDTD